MSYAIEIDTNVIDKMAEFSDVIQIGIERNLVRLAEAPVTLSTKSGFPHPATANGQRFTFDVDELDGVRHYFAAFFYYGSDEQHIRVFALTHTRF